MADHETLVPRMAGVLEEDRLRALPLAAVDRFVLSLVDGKTSVTRLADTIGLGTEEVIASLLKLEAMHVVVLPSPSPAPRASKSERPPMSARPDPRQASPRRPPPLPPNQAPHAAVAPPHPPARAAPAPPSPAPPSPPARAVEEEIDLEPDHQREIASTFARLATLDHYGILGVERTADRKAIKRAYFEKTSRFHPDRFFRRRLGSFKLKMESVFGRMTEAHDTLTSNDRRAEYDAYLGSIDKTRSIEQMLADAVTEMKRAEEAAIGAATSSATSSAPPPPPSRPAPAGRTPPGPKDFEPPTSPGLKAFDPPTSPNLSAIIADALDGRSPSKSPSGSGTRISVPPVRSEPPGAQARRELLARRLMGSVRAPAPPKVPAIAYAKTEDAVDALKRRYEDKVSAARTSQAKKYTDAGMEARAKGDTVAAANALRVALSFDPDNTELKSAHEEVQRAADQLLVDQYLKQAEYEERSERWAEAGRSWGRVARTQTSNTKAHERAGHCLMKAAGDLHEAVALVQRAVQLEPKNAAYRRTMANVYLAAGLTLNAKRELEAALQLAPDDANTTALLKRIAKSS